MKAFVKGHTMSSQFIRIVVHFFFQQKSGYTVISTSIRLTVVVEVTMPTFYETLSIPRNATLQDMEKAYHHMQLSNHSDKTNHLSDEQQVASEALSKTINVAYETLSDDKLRQKYDKTLLSSVSRVPRPLSIPRKQSMPPKPSMTPSKSPNSTPSTSPKQDMPQISHSVSILENPTRPNSAQILNLLHQKMSQDSEF